MRYYTASLLVLISLFTFGSPAHSQENSLESLIPQTLGVILSPQIERIRQDNDLRKETIRQQAAIRIEEIRQQTELKKAQLAIEASRGNNYMPNSAATGFVQKTVNLDRSF